MCSKDDAQEADTTWTTPPVESPARDPLMKANPSTAIDNTLDQSQNIDATARKQQQQAEQDQIKSKQAVEAKVETVVETTNSNTSAPSLEDKEKFNKFEGPQNKNVGEWRMAIPRSVEIQELVRLLNEFKGYANTRYPKKPETVYVDKIVMAIRGCSSVVKSRQQAAVDAGVVGPLVEVLTGVHLKDRETCLRTTQCIMGICGKNEVATAAFQAAGVVAAMAAIMNQHKGKNTKDLEKATAMFAEDQVAKAKAVSTAAAAAKVKAQQQKEQQEATVAAAAKAQQQQQQQQATATAAAAAKPQQETKQKAPQAVEEVAQDVAKTEEETTKDTTKEPETRTTGAVAKKPQNTPSKKKRNRRKKRKKKN